jgi:hypothetical protein
MKYIIIVLGFLFILSSAHADVSKFVVPYTNGQFDVPPIEAQSGLQLKYEQDGKAAGGVWAISYVPDGTVIADIWASKATIDAMKLDPKYIWIEDISTDIKPEEPLPRDAKIDGASFGAVATTDMTVSLTAKQQTDVKKVLKDTRKMSDADIAKLKLEKRQDLKDEMLKVHKLKLSDYASGGFGAR